MTRRLPRCLGCIWPITPAHVVTTLNEIVSFTIVVSAFFMLVRSFKELEKGRRGCARCSAVSSAEEPLLSEIRDLLEARG